MWRSVETFTGQSATLSGWEKVAGVRFPLLQPYLRPTTKHSTSLPCPRRFCGGIKVVGDEDTVAICGEWPPECDAFPVSPEQTLIHALHMELLAMNLGKVLDFRAIRPEQTNKRPLWRIGTTSQVWRARAPVLLAIPGHYHSMEDLAREALMNHPTSFLFLGAKLERISSPTQLALKNLGAGQVDLEEAVEVTGRGDFLLRGSLASLVGLCGLAQTASEEDGPRLERTGDSWSFHFQGKSTNVRDTLGVSYLRTLLGNPGNAVHVLRMAALHQGQSEQRGASTGQAVLDEKAIASYQERLGTIAEALERAKQNNDLMLAESLEDEEEALRGELKSALGLTGRRRRMGDDTEKLRKSMSKAIQRVVDTFSANHPDLGRHFHQSIRLGATLVYDPGPDIRWVLD